VKVALLGANGQLGSDLVKTRPEGIELVPLTRKEVDVTDRDRVGRVLSDIRPDLILNTSAYVKVESGRGRTRDGLRGQRRGGEESGRCLS